MQTGRGQRAHTRLARWLRKCYIKGQFLTNYQLVPFTSKDTEGEYSYICWRASHRCAADYKLDCTAGNWIMCLRRNDGALLPLYPWLIYWQISALITSTNSNERNPVDELLRLAKSAAVSCKYV